MKKLTLQEEEAMLCIWKSFPCTVKSVLEMYPEDHKIPYTTLASIFKNLQNKKYIRVDNKTFPYTFSPIIREEEYKHKFIITVR